MSELGTLSITRPLQRGVRRHLYYPDVSNLDRPISIHDVPAATFNQDRQTSCRVILYVHATFRVLGDRALRHRKDVIGSEDLLRVLWNFSVCALLAPLVGTRIRGRDDFALHNTHRDRLHVAVCSKNANGELIEH